MFWEIGSCISELLNVSDVPYNNRMEKRKMGETTYLDESCPIVEDYWDF
jgi:hypothetical protein